MNDYLYGQRVMYNNDEIVTVISVPNGRNIADQWSIWIHRPAVGYDSCVSKGNVKPLPNGQL